MSRSKHTEAQMIAAVKQMEAGRKAEDVAREVGVSAQTIYAWKSKYGGMDVSEAQEARRLRDENARLRKLVADLSLDKEALQSVIEKNGWSFHPTDEDLSAGTPARSDEGICRAHPAGQTHAERLRGELQQQTARGMPSRQLVPEPVRSKTDHRQLAQRLQPKEATQQPELQDAVGVRRKSWPWKRPRPSLLEKR